MKDGPLRLAAEIVAMIALIFVVFVGAPWALWAAIDFFVPLTGQAFVFVWIGWNICLFTASWFADAAHAERGCVGCRHRVELRTQDVCKATDARLERTETLPYSGRVVRWYGFRPTLAENRAPGAPCGPQAVLYKPNLASRILLLVTSKKPREQST